MAAEGVSLRRLAAVAARTQPVELVGEGVVVRDLEHDSRLVTDGAAFIAVSGATSDGHDFASTAVERGAAAVVAERRVDVAVPQLIVTDTRALMAPLAAEVHGHPATELTTIGVTGTNGKTTVTHMLEAIAIAAGKKVGLVGTVGARIDGAAVPLERTTPEASHLQRLLRRMVDAGVEIAAMEVSSHALAFGRADAIRFDVAAFTNLSQDHLDFHADMEDYFAVKQRLFTALRAQHCVIFVDDPWGARIAGNVEIPCRRVGFSGHVGGVGSSERGAGDPAPRRTQRPHNQDVLQRRASRRSCVMETRSRTGPFPRETFSPDVAQEAPSLRTRAVPITLQFPARSSNQLRNGDPYGPVRLTAGDDDRSRQDLRGDASHQPR